MAALVLFGGGQTLVKFMPGIPANRRVSFVFTYGLLVFGLAAPLLIAIGIKPSWLSYLARRPLDPTTVRYLLLFVPLVLVTRMFRAILQARMEIKWMTIAGKVVPIVSVAGFSTLYVFRYLVPDERLGEAILVIFCIAQLASLVLVVYHVYTRFIKVEPHHITLFLPSGFWSFSLMVSLSMVVVLILNNFDQALIFSQFEIGQLGIYRASLTTAEFVRWLPILLIQATLPLFSHLLVDDHRDQMHSAYRRIMRYNTLAATATALVIVLFLRDVLGLFGTEYVNAEGVLILLAGAFVFSGVSTVNSSFIVASGRVELGLISGVVGALLQVGTSLILVDHLGIEGAAVGKVINFGCIIALNAWFVCRIAGLKPDRKTVGLLSVFFLALSLSRVVRPESTVLILARNGILLTMFAAFALYWFAHDDYRYIRTLIRGRYEG